MPRHEDKYLGLDVPRLWEDRSITAFAAPSDAKRDGTANMVVTRDKPAAGESLDDYVARQLSELATSRDGFEQRERQTIDIGGTRAWLVMCASHGTAGALDQRLVFAPLSDGQIMCLTLTTPRADAAQMGPLFDHIVRSLTLEPTSGQRS
jgi:hypothetical protein